MNVLINWMRIGFGLVFVAAGVGKILYPADFAQIIYNYQMVPEMFVNPMAIILPWVELVCGVALATDCFKRGAATILSVLLLIFLGALWFNVSRGLDVSCGCFTVDPEAKGNLMQAAVRDTVLFAVGLVVLWRAFADAAARRASEKLWRQIKGLPDPEERRKKAWEARLARKAKKAGKKKGKDILDYAPPEPTVQDGTLVVGMASRVGKGAADDVPSFGAVEEPEKDADAPAEEPIPMPEASGSDEDSSGDTEAESDTENGDKSSGS